MKRKTVYCTIFALLFAVSLRQGHLPRPLIFSIALGARPVMA